MNKEKFSNFSKRGISHIEVILSFLIFIGFVIFALYFFSPYESTRLVNSSLTYVFNDLIEKTSVEVESYSLKLEEERVNEILEIEIKGVDAIKNVRVENNAGEEIPSKRDGDNVRIKLLDKIYTGFSGEEGFGLIRFSEGITAYSPPSDLDGVVVNDISELGPANKINVISESKINTLKDKIETEYETVKSEFNIPGRVNFGFILKFDSGGEIDALGKVPKGVEVFSNSKRVEILRTNGVNKGKIEFGDLVVRIW